jgi:hypothetical protein
VREIGDEAFNFCFNLSDVEFGERLETIGEEAFYGCGVLRSIKMPSVKTVQLQAFGYCGHLTEAEFGVGLDRIEVNSFCYCINLRRIVIPLKDNLLTFDSDEQKYNQFDECRKLTTVDLVGAEGIHKTISSLLLKSWRDEMIEEIGRINRELPDTPPWEKVNAIRLWIRSVINMMDHYRAEHNRILKEHMSQLELAVWKTKLDEKGGNYNHKGAKIDEKSSREEKRITSGADIVIKNVLPFLKLQ